MLVVSGEDNGLGEEPQLGFRADHTLDAYTGLYRWLLISDGYRCALTGARFAPSVTTLHADLEVVAVQPREQGGPLAIANYLPVIASLARPFRDGLITMEDDYRIVVPHPDLLDRTVLAALRATLVVPDDVLFRPGAEFLAHHRRYALSR